jgi:hypothetical protein
MSECTQMYSEVEKAVPSVVFSAHDLNTGSDLANVAVSLDGKPLLQLLDGRPIPFDPGDYTFTFSTPERAPVVRQVVIRAGDKYRQIAVEFALLQAKPPLSTAAHEPTATAPRSSGRRVPVASYVLGSVGVLGLGTFGVLRVIGASDFDTLKRGCSPSCQTSDVEILREKFLLGNIALGVGAGALGAAVLWYLFEPTQAAGAEVALEISPAGDGTLARVNGSF